MTGCPARLHRAGIARLVPFALAGALAACGGPSGGLSNRAPTLSVADAALEGNAPETALRVADGILAERPGDSAARLRQGEAYYALGQVPAAAASFQRVLAAQPGSAPARLGLGRTQLATDPAAAAASFRQVLAQTPGDIAALTDLGIAEDLQGRHAQAQASYRAALALAPGLVSAQANLGLSLALTGDVTGALNLLRPLAASPDATPRVRDDLAAVLAMSGDSDAARQLQGREVPQ